MFYIKFANSPLKAGKSGKFGRENFFELYSKIVNDPIEAG